MAREEAEREDLLAEATALVERAAWKVAGWAEALVLGFRQDGGTSFYFGPDPVYHFNPRRELRRAFVDGALIKAEGGRLIRLERRRLPGRVELIRYQLTDIEQSRVVDDVMDRLKHLRTVLREGAIDSEGQVPIEIDLVGRVAEWLAQLPTPLQVAASPHAAG